MRVLIILGRKVVQRAIYSLHTYRVYIVGPRCWGTEMEINSFVLNRVRVLLFCIKPTTAAAAAAASTLWQLDAAHAKYERRIYLKCVCKYRLCLGRLLRFFVCLHAYV